MHMMEEIMKKKELCFTHTSTSASTSALGVQRDSQTISKLIKPKIRIIHIFAPEIIKTDAANFRELVQRLTGKPTENSRTKKKSRRIIPNINLDHCVSAASSPPPGRTTFNQKPKKMEVIRSGGLHHCSERIKGDQDEIWSGANSGGGFLSGFAELEGFMDQLNYHEFPLMLPVAAAASQHMDAYGESLCSLHN